MKVLYLIEYLLLRLVMALINIFPVKACGWFARRIGDIMFCFAPGRRKIAFENLTLAFGISKSPKELKKISLESFRHLAVCFVEFARIPKFKKVSARHVQFEGLEHLDKAFARGRGLILVMSHLGPWEYLAFLAYLKNIPSAIIGRAIRNPYLYRYFIYLRRIINLQNSDKDAGLRPVFSQLRQNHLVAIAIDQWAGNDGIWVDFFGQETNTTSLPARLAERTGCALVPAFCLRVKPGEYRIVMQPEVAIDKNDRNWAQSTTTRLNHILEKKIREFPQQWIWAHKRWKKKRLK